MPDSAQGVAARFAAMEQMVRDLLDPEMYGYSVTAEVRDAARVALGMRPTETKTRPTKEIPNENDDAC